MEQPRLGYSIISILLADRTNGRAYASVASVVVVVVCNVMYCG